MCNLLCQYNNIYVNSYKYLKEKKKEAHTDDWKEKKEIYSVATVPIEQTKEALFAHWRFLYIEICFVSITIYMSAHINI